MNSTDLPTSETLNQQAPKEQNNETTQPSSMQSTEESIVKMEHSPTNLEKEQKSNDNDLILID